MLIFTNHKLSKIQRVNCTISFSLLNILIFIYYIYPFIEMQVGSLLDTFLLSLTVKPEIILESPESIGVTDDKYGKHRRIVREQRHGR